MSLDSNNLEQEYYVPESSPWPIVGAIALFMIALGAGFAVPLWSDNNDGGWGAYVLLLGIILVLYMMLAWFTDQVRESLSGKHGFQLGVSYQQGMRWFIFSELMFFAAFFGALFYLRVFSVPWLGGEGNNLMTNTILWPEFDPVWPLVTTPSGQSSGVMSWQGLPLINTLILLASSFTIHYAHEGLKQGKRNKLLVLLLLTVLLGCCFLFLQVEEYVEAYQELNLKLDTGVYGNTFFILTGFHGLHVTMGTLFLFVVLLRVFSGHFNKDNQFAFQAASWYWHFVDVVWLCLFVFVYII